MILYVSGSQCFSSTVSEGYEWENCTLPKLISLGIFDYLRRLVIHKLSTSWMRLINVLWVNTVTSELGKLKYVKQCCSHVPAAVREATTGVLKPIKAVQGAGHENLAFNYVSRVSRAGIASRQSICTLGKGEASSPERRVSLSRTIFTQATRKTLWELNPITVSVILQGEGGWGGL